MEGVGDMRERIKRKGEPPVEGLADPHIAVPAILIEVQPGLHTGEAGIPREI